MTALHNKLATLRFYNEFMNERKLYLMDELCSKNFVDHNPDPGAKGDREGVLAMFRGWIEAFPDLKVEVQQIVAEGDLVGAICRFTATHLGEFNGIPATGRRVEVSGMDWIRFENGLAAERWGVFDGVGMMKQLGAIPGPSVEDYKGRSKKYFETMDRVKGDLAAVREELFHPNFRAEFADGSPTLRFEELNAMAKGFWSAFPDMKHEIVSQVCEGDTVFNRIRVAGTHKGAFNGIPATNKSLEVDVMVAQTWTDGLMSREWIGVDFYGMLTQIGVISQ